MSARGATGPRVVGTGVAGRTARYGFHPAATARGDGPCFMYTSPRAGMGPEVFERRAAHRRMTWASATLAMTRPAVSRQGRASFARGCVYMTSDCAVTGRRKNSIVSRSRAIGRERAEPLFRRPMKKPGLRVPARRAEGGFR